MSEAVSGRAAQVLAPLRLCIAIPNFDRLGAQRVAIALARGFDRRRIEPWFLVHSPEGDMAKDVPDGVEVVVVDDRARHVRGAMALTRLPAYLSILRERQPEVVLGVVQYPSLALAWAKEQLGARCGLPAPWKLVCCEHSFVSKNLVDPEGYPPHFRFYYRRRFPRVYNEVADRVLVTAEEGKSDLCDSFGIDPGRIVVVPNPLDHARITRLAAEPLDDPWLPREGRPAPDAIPVVVAAGRLVVQKRFDLLIEAFARLRARRSARLLILGQGPSGPSLRALAARLGVAADVRVEDRSPPWTTMARASVFALSSEWEGFPMILAEAMVLACPIVSVACPSGPREMLEDGRGGLLVPPGDPDALAAGLERALSEPEAMAERAARAAARSEAFSVAHVCEAYTTLFEELAGRRGHA